MPTWIFKKRAGAPAGTISIDLQSTPASPDFTISDAPGSQITTTDAAVAYELLREPYLRLDGIETDPFVPQPVVKRVFTSNGELVEVGNDGSATTIPVAFRADLPYVDVDELATVLDASDSVAWQRAVDQAETSGIRRILGRKPTYTFHQNVNCSGLTDAVISGAGQGVTVISASADIAGFTTNGACSGLIFENFTMLGPNVDDVTAPRRSRTTTGAGFVNGILFEGNLTGQVARVVQDIEVRNCSFIGIPNLPVFLKGLHGYAKVTGCYIENCLDTGFTFNESAIFTNNVVRKSADNGVSLSRGNQKVTCVGNDIDGSCYAGVWVSGYLTDRAPDNVVVSGNTITNSGLQGIKADGAPKYVSITGNVINGVKRGPSDEPNDFAGVGIKVGGHPTSTPLSPTDYATAVTITGNTIVSAERGGILFVGAKAPAAGDNTIIDCGSEFYVADGSLPASSYGKTAVALAQSTSTFTLNSHGLANDDKVTVRGGDAAGFTYGTTYYVIGATANTFQLSASIGGAAVSATADVASLAVAKAIPTTSTTMNFGIAADTGYESTVSDAVVTGNRIHDFRTTPFCNRAVYLTGTVRPYRSGNRISGMRSPQAEDGAISTSAPSGTAARVSWQNDGVTILALTKNTSNDLELNAYSTADGSFLKTQVTIGRSSNIWTFADGVDFAFGGSSGTKIGRASNHKLGFYGATPVVRPSRPGQLTDNSGGTASSTIAAISDTATKNAVASVVAKVNAIEAALSSAGGGVGLTA